MSVNTKLLAGLIVGAAAGSLIAVLLDNEPGREIIANIKNATGRAIDEIKQNVQNFSEEQNTENENQYV